MSEKFKNLFESEEEKKRSYARQLVSVWLEHIAKDLDTSLTFSVISEKDVDFLAPKDDAGTTFDSFIFTCHSDEEEKAFDVTFYDITKVTKEEVEAELYKKYKEFKESD